ncbi:MAG: EAL domain-containing protein [Firmicutes bacterium]|nr:EAL domain-containing protein [Bacillota bacterium]
MIIINSVMFDFNLQELNNIIENKKIRTLFQPIVNIKNGRILGYEALSRGPAGTNLENPIRLFDSAKKHGKLFLLESICREKALKRAHIFAGEYKLFINIDPHVIYDTNFQRGTTRQLLKHLSLSQQNIVIEITERTSINDFNTFKKALKHYRRQGYRIALDDTGAGYSGLQSLVSIAFDYIKIDRSLISDIDRDKVKQALLESLVQFGHKISSSLIAEGVERKEELDALNKLGVDYVQGYYIARPAEKICKRVFNLF